MADIHHDNYEDIIGLPHHVSAVHTPMSMYARAAQFAPFAALNGHEEAIAETARLTSARKHLSEDECLVLSKKLAYIAAHIAEMPILEFTYFSKDNIKAGGKYISRCGIIKRYDEYGRKLILSDDTILKIDDIISIEGDIVSDI